MKKILINASSVKMGGALTYIQNLAEGLLNYKKDFEFIFVLPKSLNKDILNKIEKNYKIILVDDKSYFPRFYFDQVKIRQIIKDEKINILFSAANFATIFCPSKQVLLIRNALYFSKDYLNFRKKNSKKIPLLRRIKFKAESILWHFLVKFSILASDIVVLPSQSMLDDLKQFIKIPADKKIYINYYGIDIEKFFKKTEKKIFGDKIKFLFSSYGEHKNFSTLLEALILFKKENKDFELISLFDLENPLVKRCFNYYKDKDLILNSEIKGNLKFMGNISYSNLPSVYQQADIFIWPTLAESFGHPLLEAMASGLPIIVSDIPINREIAGDSVIYFESLNPQDLCDKIKLLIQNEDLRKQLSETGKKRVQEFTWEKHMRQLIEIFEKNIKYYA